MGKREILFYTLFLLFPFVGLVSCGKFSEEKTPVKIHRFDKLLFEVSPQELPAHLQKNEKEFAFFFDAPLTDSAYLREIILFASDSIAREIYDSVAKKYSDLKWLENELGEAFNNAKKQLPDSTIIPQIYVLSGTDFDYDTRVLGSEKFMAIALQDYTVSSFQKYNYFGLPLYLVNILDSSFIAGDCMDTWCQQLFVPKKPAESLLEFMIERGKRLYFKDIALPEMPDNIKIRYSEKQLEWCKANEGFMWSFFVQQNLLYEKDYLKIRAFVNEAPKTSGFADAPGRFADFIGWQIVRKYVKKQGVSLQELMQETDAQKILKESGYKPKMK